MELYEHVPFLTAATRRKRILLECSIQQIAAVERYTISRQISNPSPFFSTVEIVVTTYIMKSFNLKVCALIQYNSIIDIFHVAGYKIKKVP